MQIFKFQLISCSERGREINNIQCIFYLRQSWKNRAWNK